MRRILQSSRITDRAVSRCLSRRRRLEIFNFFRPSMAADKKLLANRRRLGNFNFFSLSATAGKFQFFFSLGGGSPGRLTPLITDNPKLLFYFLFINTFAYTFKCTLCIFFYWSEISLFAWWIINQLYWFSSEKWLTANLSLILYCLSLNSK
jgi:hypothetical protein